MIGNWQWDPTLFQGSARYYARGRLPYPAGLASALAQALGLDGAGRLLDVGCGPGIVALQLAHLFTEVVGVDADGDMLSAAAAAAADLGITNARWVHTRAEEIAADLGAFRVATFAASFHWMDRDLVAATIREMLEPGGAFVQISAQTEIPPEREAIKSLIIRYLGPERRAGQGVLRHATPGDELDVLRRAGFGSPSIIDVPGGAPIVRTIDDVVATVFSHSACAPHLFGDDLQAFEADLRALLVARAPSGEFQLRIPDAELRIWRRPP